MNTTQANSHSERRDRLIQNEVHDPYKSKTKPTQPTVCPACQAVFSGGRWQWLDSWPEDARQETCQACLRTQDDYPAGLVTLEGSFLENHREEILQLLKNQEEVEKSSHPQHRIMSIEEKGNTIVVKTTDLHLPRRLGEAVHRAYNGTLDTHYNEDDWFVRIHWTRDE